MAGRNKQRNQMRGQGQGSRGGRYEQYGEGSQDDMDYDRGPYGGGSQGQDWGREGQYESQERYGSQQGGGQYGAQGGGVDREQQGTRWEPRGKGGYESQREYGRSPYGKGGAGKGACRDAG